jgi:hypothetical protein
MRKLDESSNDGSNKFDGNSTYAGRSTQMPFFENLKRNSKAK